MALAAALTVVLVPAGAIATTQLLTTDQVAASLPQGTIALMSTYPTCATVTASVEYHCVLASAPDINGAPTDASGNPKWLSTVEATVDAGKHVNGAAAHRTRPAPSGSATSARPRCSRTSSARASSASPLRPPGSADQLTEPGVERDPRLRCQAIIDGEAIGLVEEHLSDEACARGPKPAESVDVALGR